MKQIEISTALTPVLLPYKKKAFEFSPFNYIHVQEFSSDYKAKNWYILIT